MLEENVGLQELEVLLIQGMQAREREIMRLYFEPFQTDFQKVIRSIESRMNLPAGAIGTTHVLELDKLIVMPAPATEKQEESSLTEEQGNSVLSE
jgi:hypothetical protein